MDMTSMRATLSVHRSLTSLLESLESRRLFAFGASVNFQPANAPAVTGHTSDTGKVFGTNSEGLSFGWNADNQLATRDRNHSAAADQRYDTLTHFQKQPGRVWEMVVPNGTYDVRVVAGDALYQGDYMVINVEAATAIKGTTTSANRWFDRQVRVNVTDGRLTIQPGAGSINAKINFVTVRQVRDASVQAIIPNVFAQAETVARQTLADLNNDASRYVNYTKADGTWNVIDHTKWTSGFWPGVMWELHAYTKNTSWRDSATRWTRPLATQTQKQGDLAFRFMPAYLPLYQFTRSSADRAVLLQAADAKMQMWNETVGAFETTWFRTKTANPRANFAVLMDMTTDLELLMWAFKETGNTLYRDRSVRHMQTVVRHLVADDGGTRHFGMFDRSSGQFIGNETYQGYADNSVWGRGQAWAIYSFAHVARDTQRPEFLSAAQKVADYYLQNAPADKVTFWDFNDPRIPGTWRDTSAAAVVASGLLQIAELTPDPARAAVYHAGAEQILTSLATSYLNPAGSQRGLLSQGALDVPSQPDTANASIIFGDYYFLQALNRYARA
jgi:unsaturated chondroitin disaccharide hydrolase